MSKLCKLSKSSKQTRVTGAGVPGHCRAPLLVRGGVPLRPGELPRRSPVPPLPPSDAAASSDNSNNNNAAPTSTTTTAATATATTTTTTTTTIMTPGATAAASDRGDSFHGNV